MKKLKDEVKNEIIINKSRFITYLYIVNNINDVKNKLNEISNIYKDATHICYAYIISNQQKASDDREPQGTAGIPILEVLTRNNLNNVLAIVIRYFGGIKLGSGGLMRAYSNSISKCLNETTLEEIVPLFHIIINESYNKQKQIEYLLKEDKIIKKDFSNNLIYEAVIKKETLDKLSNISYHIIDKL